ncbi:uncharacterized protein LOC143362889 [Halictus rubicundus]|uniref:uncharacterized protein LOC143362889 n=1 Tax=Halictus rubicundus TaxID=77578 RepID=UPI004036568D
MELHNGVGSLRNLGCELVGKKSPATLTNDHRLLTRFWGHEEYRKDIHVQLKNQGGGSARSTLLHSPVIVYKARASDKTHGRSSEDMIGKIVLLLTTLALANAQVPSLGFCPDYVPMANFDMSKFLGVWYEAERYFQLTEVVSRCVMANYTLDPDGKFRVSNEVTNRFTGIKRVVEGEIKKAASKAEEGKLIVKYTIPLTPETKYSVLETDYDSYAVLWSCSGIGPFHTQNAWVMTRERIAPGPTLQQAYSVLDKYKISRTFFVKTDQDDCAYLAATTSKPEEASAEAPQKNQENVRSAIVPDSPALIAEQADKKDEKEPLLVPAVENLKKIPVKTVPEQILVVANAAKGDPQSDSVKTLQKKEASEPANEKAPEDVKAAVKTVA